ncbi:hypothetical protein BTS2_2616 [Bacillus sp. TS-2]|nr:hypothetical protein BTS2_2616 [Bacillus sp. TS-2]
MKFSSYITGFVTGVSISAVASLLLAPKSGQELRHSIKSSANATQRNFIQIKNDGQELIEQLKETTQIGQQAVKELSNELVDSVEKWKNDVEPSIQSIKRDIHDLQKNIDIKGK